LKANAVFFLLTLGDPTQGGLLEHEPNRLPRIMGSSVNCVANSISAEFDPGRATDEDIKVVHQPWKQWLLRGP